MVVDGEPVDPSEERSAILGIGRVGVGVAADDQMAFHRRVVGVEGPRILKLAVEA